MKTKPINISLSRFTDFLVTDHLGQVAKLREIQRQFEEPYGRGGDFWAGWRDGAATHLAESGSRSSMDLIASSAHERKRRQYESACAGLQKYVGRKDVECLRVPSPVIWTYDRLNVRLNPDLEARIGDVVHVVKWHLKQDLMLDQRTVNPLLDLMESHFGGDGRIVTIVDVHRGRGFVRTRSSPDFETTLWMQAASFVLGWAELEGRRAA